MQVPDHSCRSLILTSNVVLRIMHKQRAGKCSDKRSSSERNVSVNARFSAFRFMRAIRSERSGVRTLFDTPVDCGTHSESLVSPNENRPEGRRLVRRRFRATRQNFGPLLD